MPAQLNRSRRKPAAHVRIDSPQTDPPVRGMSSKIASGLLLCLVALLLASEAFGTSAASLDSVSSETGFSIAPVIRSEATRAGVALVLGILAPLGLRPVTQSFNVAWPGREGGRSANRYSQQGELVNR